jgi:dGTPase
VDAAHPGARTKLKFNEALRHCLDFLATDLITETRRRVEESGAASTEDIRRAPKRLAGFSDAAAERNAELKRFLYARLYSHPAITEDRDRSVRSLEELFWFYMEKPEALPPFYATMAKDAPRHVVVCDYIAGMTDQFLLRCHREQLGASSRAAS